MREKLLRGADLIVFWLSALMMGFLTVISFLGTAYFTAESSFAERPEYRMDFVPAHIVFFALIFFLIVYLSRKGVFDRISPKIFCAAVSVFVTVLSILWIEVSHTYPEADQKAVSWVAWLLSQDNFLFFEHGKYMQIYPNQLGLAAILEALYRLFGQENWKLFMYLTAIANGVAVWLLYLITDRLFHSKKADILVLFAAAGCVQIVLYSTFLYGMMLGLAFALAAFYFLLIFFEKEKLRYGILSGVLIGISVLIKNNYSIFLVAMVILTLYKGVKDKSGKKVFGAFFLILLTGAFSAGLTSFYEYRSGMEIGNGMPKSLWIAMGMQEGERAEGWYNEFNFNTFTETDCDEKESDAIAKESIRESLERFRKEPQYAMKFYFKKTMSQWAEPTCEALWVNQFHSGDFSKIVQSIYDGKLYIVLHEYMNLFQTFVYSLVFFYLWNRRKTGTMEALFFPLVILGGFLFHTLWEAKSQYIFPYFVCMLPVAAMGLSEAAQSICRKTEKRKKFQLVQEEKGTEDL